MELILQNTQTEMIWKLNCRSSLVIRRNLTNLASLTVKTDFNFLKDIIKYLDISLLMGRYDRLLKERHEPSGDGEHLTQLKEPKFEYNSKYHEQVSKQTSKQVYTFYP